LRLSDLHSLDVVLSQSSRLGSKVNARLARGDFSHASFVIDEHFWFDAVPAGCGKYSPAIDAVPGAEDWYLDLRPYRRVRVLRHPLFAFLSEQRRMELQELAREYCDLMIGTSYARYEMLLPLVRYPLLKRALERWPKASKKLARTLDWVHAALRANRGMRSLLTWESILCGYKGTSAYFCSEVIVNIYEALGLDIARDGTSAGSFTPDDLYDETRSLLETVDIVLHECPTPEPRQRHRERDKLMAESERILASAMKFLREIEDSQREAMSVERLERYLASALSPSPKLAEKASRIGSAVAALLQESNRLLQLNLNLEDLEDIGREQPAIYANQSLREWLNVVEERLRRDGPVRPQTKELARKGLAELGSSATEKSSAANKLYNGLRPLLRNCIELHAAASRTTFRLLKS
jgi:hypothetical protein